jgi:hypothetical protein
VFQYVFIGGKQVPQHMIQFFGGGFPNSRLVDTLALALSGFGGKMMLELVFRRIAVAIITIDLPSKTNRFINFG